MTETSFSHLIVVGSSAGGIEALSELFSTLPEDFAAPIVIAQHLDPNQTSHLREILSRRSPLPIRTVTEHEPLEAGVVFVVPADRHVNIINSEIDLREDSAGRPKPSVDLLLSSAAKAYGERLIAVILTGTGSDGADGARAVREAGGTVIVQNPETAQFAGMPRALAPTSIDITAELERIGPILEDLLSGLEVSEGKPREDEERSLKRFLEQLRDRQGLDFTSYKTPTILRRLKHRMVATQTSSIEDYSRYLSQNPEEYQHLVNAFLIKVTEFFRDPELYAYLEEEILPRLIKEARENGNQLRIWSAGCATGEEAYSLAIMVSELLGGEAGLFSARIFATDVDKEAINFARQGIYPASALKGLSEEQVDRYFTREDGGQYQVNKPVRSVIVFGERLRTGAVMLQLETRVLLEDGSQRWMLWTAIPVVEDGVIYKAGRDITGLKQAEEERERFLAREWVARAEAAERRRIDRELHDRVAHSMGVVHQSIDLYKAFLPRDPSRAEDKLALAQEMAKTALNSTRDLSMALREPVTDGDLEGTLSSFLENSVPPEIETKLSVEGDESSIPVREREQLFLILREAARNAVSHSGCDRLSVHLDVAPEEVVGLVEDDGRGFDPEGPENGSGLRSMQERAALVSGVCEVHSEPGGGTSVRVSIPLTPEL